MSWIALALLLVPYFALASCGTRERLQSMAVGRPHAALMAGALLVPYLLVAGPTAWPERGRLLDGLVRMTAYVQIPTWLLAARPRGARPDAHDLFAVLALWFPIEFGWLPRAEVALAPRIELPLPKLIGVDLALLSFLVFRPLEGIGYTFRLTRRDVAAAAVAFLALAVVALPLSFAIRFVSWQGLTPRPLGWLLALAGIYLMIAIPEELLFRGVLQNAIERLWGRSWTTLLAAALVFGAAHLNNATAGHAAPNFRYLLLASLAGIAYGWAWRVTGKVTAAAVSHALVDWLWGIALKA